MTTKNKHIPQRTCIACRQSKAKKDLIRVICTSDGVVEVDPSSKKPGRGAYLCPKRDCWEMGLKGNRLERALRTKLSSDKRQALIEYSKSLP
jgi:hypothetical protein